MRRDLHGGVRGKRLTAVVVAMLLAMSHLCGCGQGAEEAGNASDAENTMNTGVIENVGDEEDTVLEDLLATCEYITPEMYARATSYAQGDLTRLAAVMRKGLAGESITVGVIGGSITEGYSAKNKDRCYANLMKEWWETAFPDSEIKFVNAGIGATDSYLGVHRVQKDLLDYEPDFVIVEFSVNDSDTNLFKKSYENLVRRIILSDKNPAVMLVFMTQENGTSAQNGHAQIGFQYGLPMISYKNAIMEEVNNGTILWKDISPDNIHPNDKGHAILGELITTYLSDVLAHVDTYSSEVTPFTAAVQTKDSYMNATILDSTNCTPDSMEGYKESAYNYFFPNGWETTEGGTITFTVEARNIGLMYEMMKDGTGGHVEIIVDGVSQTSLNTDFSSGWGEYLATKEVYTSAETATHTIEIRFCEDSEKLRFILVGLLIS